MPDFHEDFRAGATATTTPEQRRRAALTVCDRATDMAEAAELLAMLGLDQEAKL